MTNDTFKYELVLHDTIYNDSGDKESEHNYKYAGTRCIYSCEAEVKKNKVKVTWKIRASKTFERYAKIDKTFGELNE